ncbi:lipid-binding SYLF domain-containing protein [Thermaurantiacus sp.]
MSFLSTRRLALGLAAATAIAFSVPAAAKETPQDIVDASAATLSTMLADSKMDWLRNNISRARGVMISPRIVKAGFIIGGSGGNAVLLTRGADGRWSGPAFYNLSTGSVGFQAGFSEAEAVTLLMTEKAVDKMMAGSVKMGGDLSIATGPVGGGAKSNVKADLITFTRAKGIYGGVNMTGTGVGTDASRNAEYWSKPGVTPIQILVERSVTPNPGADRLVKLVTYQGSR